MVYIIQCLDVGVSLKKDELEAYRQEFAKQIRQGVLLLPVTFKLVEVVKTESIIDVEIVKDQQEVAEKIYAVNDEEYDKEDLGGICVNCRHWLERTPLGRNCGKDLHGNDCGWCDAESRITSPIAGCKKYFKHKNKEENEND